MAVDSAAMALAKYAAEHGLGVEGESVFWNLEPSAAIGLCITFYDAPGEPPVFTQDDEGLPSIEIPRVRVAVRGKKPSEIRPLAYQVYELMHQRRIAIEDTFFPWIQPTGRPYALPPDANDRLQLGITVRVKVRN